MKKIMLVLLLCGSAAAQSKAIVEAPKPLRTVTLTAEQNRLLVEINQQMKDLQTRLQAILDTIAATNKLSTSALNEVKPGEYELRELPPKTETKTEEKPKPKEEHQ